MSKTPLNKFRLKSSILRIGNIVINKHTNKIHLINSKDIKECNDNFENFPYQDIELTEYWLDKFSIYEDNYFFYLSNDIAIQKHNFHICSINDESGATWTLKRIRTVSDLQNTFFFLTDNETYIKEEILLELKNNLSDV